MEYPYAVHAQEALLAAGEARPRAVRRRKKMYTIFSGRAIGGAPRQGLPHLQ
jgi:hypothetical protein